MVNTFSISAAAALDLYAFDDGQAWRWAPTLEIRFPALSASVREVKRVYFSLLYPNWALELSVSGPGRLLQSSHPHLSINGLLAHTTRQEREIHTILHGQRA